jgi:hypothetical protein
VLASHYEYASAYTFMTLDDFLYILFWLEHSTTRGTTWIATTCFIKCLQCDTYEGNDDDLPTMFAAREPMALQWRGCSRWGLLGSIQAGDHEAFLIVDPLIRKDDVVALLQHLVPTVLQSAHLWQYVEPPKAGLFG